jgi:hypothetical protein
MEKLKPFWRKWRETLLTIFIVFNIVAIVIGCTQVIQIPFGVRKIFYPYLGWTRLAQSWFLFAPEPKRVAIKYRVDIIFKDETTAKWYRPYPGNWSFFERHEAYQFQKFDLGSNHLMKDPDARKDFCSYVMRLHWNEQNPPEYIALFQEIAKWPEPKEGQPLSYDESRLKFVDHFVARYKVNAQGGLE